MESDEHLLMNTWTYYIHVDSQSDTYLNSYKKVLDFDSCEGWARLFNNIPDAGTLLSLENEIWCESEKVSAYSIFKEDIKPEWEDENNCYGCEWGCRQEIEKSDANIIWKHLVASVVCGQLDALGVRVVNKNTLTRSISKIEVWLGQYHDPAATYAMIQQVLTGCKLQREIPNFQLIHHDNRHRETMDFNEKKKRKNRWFKSEKANKDW